MNTQRIKVVLTHFIIVDTMLIVEIHFLLLLLVLVYHGSWSGGLYGPHTRSYWINYKGHKMTGQDMTQKKIL